MTVLNTAAWTRETEAATEAATAAGRAIKELYDRTSVGTYTKTDGSPVTEADFASDRIIRDILTERFPNDPILSEEGTDDAPHLAADRCWIVDPLDGTAQFVARTGEFDVRLALVVDGRPVVAVIYRPVDDVLYAAALDHGAWSVRNRQRSALRFDPVTEDRPLRLATSIWLGNEASLPALERVAARVGAGAPERVTTGFGPHDFAPPFRRFDAMIGFGRESGGITAWEWDFAPADLIMHEAGGRFTDVLGRAHRYNKPSPRNVGGLVASVDPTIHNRLLAALASESELQR